jgi:predicted CXXCH cytochrome family protein
MKTTTSHFVFALGLALYLLLNAHVPALAATNPYAGPEKCATCHKGIYEAYQRSGHPYKVQKVTSGPPIYPPGTSPGVPLPPDGLSWRDISYVIGGYGWKARFMDKEGYILTGPVNRQYNLANQKLSIEPHWTGYDADKGTRKPYTCGSCHTTGWKDTGKDGPHQDGLPGIHGTWASPGVSCEGCHGPGAAHAANPGTVKLSVQPNCDSCHVRGDVTKIDASGGLVRHHEQYEDLLASPHREMACTTCHEPHLSTRYGLGGFKGQAKTCALCHQEQVTARVAPEPHRACINCHMPYAGKSAVSKTIAYKGGSLPVGDIRSHIIRINSNPAWSLFSDDGGFVRTDDRGKAYLTVDYTCLSCHTGKDKAWAAKNAKRIHGGK